MLFLHEVHRVVGSREDEFEAAFRDPGGWMDRLGGSGDARLLWYLNQAHGAGPSYQVTTITAIADGGAWERLARSIQSGALKSWMAELDTVRHDVDGKLLLPLPWSPLSDLKLADVPITPGDHELSLYMEDTMWPFAGCLDRYVEQAGTFYAGLLARPEALLRMEAAFQPAYGTHERREVSLLQRVRDPEGLMRLLATEIPAERRAPGTWMHDALSLRDRWESKLLRSAPWSPRW